MDDDVFKMDGPGPRTLTREEMQDIKRRAMMKVARMDLEPYTVYEGDRISITYTIRVGDDTGGGCGEVLHGIHPIPKCHLKAGHEGEHKSTNSWPNEHNKEFPCLPPSST